MTNGECLFRTKLKENSNCGSCGDGPDDKHHMFVCSTFPKTSSGLQNLLNHVTGKPFNMENLANLHIELEEASLQLPFTFLLARRPMWGKQKRELDINESKHLGKGIIPATDSQSGIRLHRHRHVADKLLCLVTPRPLPPTQTWQ